MAIVKPAWPLTRFPKGAGWMAEYTWRETEEARRLALPLLRQLVAIPTWKGQQEREALLVLKEWLRGHGVPAGVVEGDDAWALISTLVPQTKQAPCGDTTLILNTHIDTVPPSHGGEWRHSPLEMVCEGQSVVGLGVADAKGCVAAMAAAFVALHDAWEGPHSVQLMVVSGEETGGRGTRMALQRGVSANGAAVVGEPTSLRACIATKGVLRLGITARGKAAHASQPQAGRNAIYAMAALVGRLETLAASVGRRTERWTGHSSLAVTLMEGGCAHNIVPPSCHIHVDRRLVPGERADAAQAEVQAVVDATAAQHPGIRFDVERCSVLLPVLTCEDDAIAQAAAAATGGEPLGFSACCDLSFITHEGGIPGVILGPGSLHQAHQANESLAVAELEACVDLYIALAKRWKHGTAKSA